MATRAGATPAGPGPDPPYPRGASTATLAIITAGMVLYGILFLSTRLRDLQSWTPDGRPPRRATFLWHVALGYDLIVASWSGDARPSCLIDRAAILLSASLILAGSTGIGWCALWAANAHGLLRRAESMLFSAGVGLNLVSLYVLSLGLAGKLRDRWLLTMPAAAAVVVAALHGRRTWPRLAARRAGNAESAAEASRTDWLNRWWIVAAFPLVAVVMLGSMLPPIEFDVREYHLQAPKEFFLRGQIAFLPHNVYANMPLGPQMLALLAMVLHGDWWTGALVGKTLIGMVCVLTAVALYLAGRRFFGRTAGVVAALTYLSVPWMVRVSTLGQVEGVYAFYLFLTVYALLLRRGATASSAEPTAAPALSAAPRRPAPAVASATRMLVVAGFFAGAAVGCKYTAVVFVMLPLAAYVICQTPAVRVQERLPSQRPSRFSRVSRFCLNFRAGLIFLAAGVVSCGLWFAKNLALTGNPTYPLLYGLFDGATRTAEKHLQWQHAHRPDDYLLSDAAARMADFIVCSDGLSLPVIPLAVVGVAMFARRKAVVWMAGYVAWVLLVWWLTTHRIERFWIPIFPVLALLAGAGAVWTSVRAWRVVVQTVLALGLASSLLLITGGLGGYNRYVMAYADARISAERVSPWHAFLNTHVPFNHKVLVVGDAQVFDLEMPVLYNTVFDDVLLEKQLAGRSIAQLHAWLIDQRISHVFVNWDEIARYRSPGNYGYSDFITPQLFARLVDRQVLAPIEFDVPGRRGKIYSVLPWTPADRTRNAPRFSVRSVTAGTTAPGAFLRLPTEHRRASKLPRARFCMKSLQQDCRMQTGVLGNAFLMFR